MIEKDIGSINTIDPSTHVVFTIKTCSNKDRYHGRESLKVYLM